MCKSILYQCPIVFNNAAVKYLTKFNELPCIFLCYFVFYLSLICDIILSSIYLLEGEDYE